MAQVRVLDPITACVVVIVVPDWSGIDVSVCLGGLAAPGLFQGTRSRREARGGPRLTNLSAVSSDFLDIA